MTKTLKCDKPVDLDEARKAKGLPRRKRDDPKATAYELRIRVPAEFQGVMGAQEAVADGVRPQQARRTQGAHRRVRGRCQQNA